MKTFEKDMYFLKWLHINIFIIVLTCISCQRYAERDQVPAPAVPPYYYNYDDYPTEAYDYDDNTIFRWNVIDYPHPRRDLTECHVEKPSTICDPDSILEKNQLIGLQNIINNLYNSTPCICETCHKDYGGIIIGIALLKNVFQPYNIHPAKIVRSFAENLRTAWKLGNCDNDILIVVITDDRLSYTDVGKATAVYVSLSDAHAIFLENKAHFSAGHFYKGLEQMLLNYEKKTLALVEMMKTKKKLNIGAITGIIVGVVLLIGLSLLIFALIKYYKKHKVAASNNDVANKRTEGVPSGWKRKDIKVIFNSLITTDKKNIPSAKYQPCDTEDKSSNPKSGESLQDDEFIDTTLQICEPDSQQPSRSIDTSKNTKNEMITNEEVRIEQPNQTNTHKEGYTGHITAL